MSEKLSVRQERFKYLVDNNVRFYVKGYSLIAHGEEFPIRMAKVIGIKPMVFDIADEGRLEKAWSKL
jgi:hypothetical protein